MMLNIFQQKKGYIGFLWHWVLVAMSMLMVVFLASRDLFKAYMPRARNMEYIKSLILTQSIGDFLITLYCIGISVVLFWFVVRGKGFKHRYIYFMFAVGHLFIALRSLFDFITIWRNYSWILGMIKIAGGVLGCLIFTRLPSIISDMLKLQTFNEVEALKEARDQLHDTKNKVQKMYFQISELEYRMQERWDNQKIDSEEP